MSRRRNGKARPVRSPPPTLTAPVSEIAAAGTLSELAADGHVPRPASSVRPRTAGRAILSISDPRSARVRTPFPIERLERSFPSTDSTGALPWSQTLVCRRPSLVASGTRRDSRSQHLTARQKEWISRLEQAWNHNRLEQELRRLKRPHLSPSTRSATSSLNARAATCSSRSSSAATNAGPIIITSNRGFGHWGEIRSDAMVAVALSTGSSTKPSRSCARPRATRVRERGRAVTSAAHAIRHRSYA